MNDYKPSVSTAGGLFCVGRAFLNLVFVLQYINNLT
jgi:hypothetical protein